MSARPALCGGYRVSGIPTAINSHAALPKKQLSDNIRGIHKSLGVTRNQSGHRQITSGAFGSYWRNKPSMFRIGLRELGYL